MKRCPHCELNYIDDFEEMCDICYVAVEERKKPKYNKAVIDSHLVSLDTIYNKITANAIFQAVRYLTYEYGEYSIYKTDNPNSYRNILKKLQSRFYYAKEKYSSGAGFAYVFEADDIWNYFFLADNDYNETITHRKIDSISELISRAKYWHSLPFKQRRV